ncbi:GNAT family N-acetyltransferase [Marinitenerispora sediminis]|uniref:GNAT family N-acetyltransferase n=1 Tax=Marinitenerispora sediminis TaxID=1931232 RepID=A0A368T6B7_9ACTN|nr:GNAT family N-acetyltransferase [Marinitenerispora sediminis]RCV49160.1 GNAT family N-acetyltransferase [Marinitenerispora sediminis]RCV55943.1 GNAT family N-acetyltransferase [Marinitenerispora sediminis]RCV60399.1 GNAT family N-acetyltransferase [Marinitenerispora sediminis]
MPQACVRVRAVRTEDLAAVAGIYRHYVLHTRVTFDEVPPTPRDWQERAADLTRRGLPFLVAELDGAVVGYAYAAPWKPKPAYRHTVENSVYLAPDRTGRGLGGRLLAELLEECARCGVHQVVAVIADSGTESSAALHLRHGFTEVGRLRRVGRKHGRWIDTRLFQCAIGVDAMEEQV